MFEQPEVVVGRMLPWIVLLPLAGAIINGTAGRGAAKGLVTAVGVGSVAVAFAFAVVCFLALVTGEAPAASYQVTLYEWFDVAGYPIRVRFVMDHLAAVMTLVVTGVGTLIHVYSIGYMADDDGYARFFTYLNLFMAAMLVLVLASNIPLMFVGWEGVGLCSYLLIGFWYKNVDYAEAGKKAFVVNRIGDFGVLIGIFIILAYAQRTGVADAFEFRSINENAWNIGRWHWTVAGVDTGVWVVTAATLFLFLGCTGKSAQIPLFVWLPDAMAGPTPVSALIHAATMVTAGVYLCCRLSPFMVESPFALSVIALVGAATALVAATIAVAQNQMKKILAYSTVSQLGFMFAAVGSGAFAAGIFHVFTHAFFKACLFLGAGSVMHAIGSHSDADIRYQGGLRRVMPSTHWTFAVSCAAIAGLPFFSGFFSKDEILLGAATWGAESPYAPWVGWTVFAILVVSAVLTAFYMFRLYFRTFWGEFRGGHAPGSRHGDDHGHGEVHPHESPPTMTGPLMALAVGAALVGFLGMPHWWGAPNAWGAFLAPRYEAFLHALEHEGEEEPHDGGAAAADGEEHGAEAGDDHHGEAVRAAMREADQVRGGLASLQFRDLPEGRPEGADREASASAAPASLVHAPLWVALLAMACGLLAAFGGVGLAYAIYAPGGNEAATRIARRVPRLHRFFLDKWRVDELYGATVVAWTRWAAVLSANFDRLVVDGLLTKVTAELARATGWLLTRFQNGVVSAYAAMFVLGFAALGWFFLYPHAGLTAEAAGGEVEWTARPGVSYEYRWDLDSDGAFDTEWGPSATTTVDYRDAEPGTLAVLFRRSVRGDPAFLTSDEELIVRPGDAVPIPDAVLGAAWTVDLDASGRRPTLGWEDGQIRVDVHDARIPDLDDDPEDGVAHVPPGSLLSLFNGYRMEVALRVRATVEVRNAFGNRSRASRTVTVSLGRSATPRARALSREAGR
ncbi:MAG: NADH-quinone oxidoreductase subunit L [Sandaracinaceae bacterium]